MIYFVCVAPKYRKRICTGGRIWVKSNDTEGVYVTKKDRGVFATREEAQSEVSIHYEIVVAEPGEAHDSR